VSGLDGSPALLELARGQVPEADLRLGDLQRLPWESASFGAVTSFTSYWFAADPVEALREAGRVAKPGAPVLVTVHGQGTDLTAVMDAIGALLGRERGTLPFEAHLRAAGLELRATGTLPITLEFADEAALLRQLLAPAAMVGAARAVGEERVIAAIREAVPGLTLRHEWRYAIVSPSVL
jgi:SAM-dependent methyltransferase